MTVRRAALPAARPDARKSTRAPAEGEGPERARLTRRRPVSEGTARARGRPVWSGRLTGGVHVAGSGRPAQALVALTVAAATLALLPAAARAAEQPSFVEQARAARAVARHRIAATERSAPRRNFAYYTVGDAWKYSGPRGWAAGYVPGELWSCYQMTAGDWWRRHALSRQRPIAEEEITVHSLNLGALFYPSFARGYRLTGDPALRAVALKAARTMARRYDPVVGAMLSRPGPEFNVIIDSLMKSQFLWWAAKNGGGPRLAEIADRHALTIARDFVREDGSTWHMVFYDTTTGQISHRDKGSAYSLDTTWARGQAWAVLGFSAAYRETGDERFLVAARKVADWYLVNVPEDRVPYWDFLDPGIPGVPRDSSSAAIAASGMVDLSLVEPSEELADAYLQAARATLLSLMSPAYLSRGSNPAVLLHGTYSRHMDIVDRGLAYGDAFFLEALLRLRRVDPGAEALAVTRARADEGVPAAVLDGDFGTRWVSRGRAALELRLAATQEVGAVRVALAGGDRRAARLVVSVSRDGLRWRRVLRTMTGGETAGYETLDFPAVPARWVRIGCSGTTTEAVNRLAEVRVLPPL